MSITLDLVKAPQQIKDTLRRLEQVRGPGQNTARLLSKKMTTECWTNSDHDTLGLIFFFSSFVEE